MIAGHRLLLILVALAGFTGPIAGAQTLDCPTFSSGGATTSDGSLFAIGQIAIGPVGTAAQRVHQGVVPCWTSDGGGRIGDMNCDGLVSVSDIGPFVLAVTDPAAYSAAFPNCDIVNGDINGDGFVSVGDIGPFVALLAP